MSPTQAQLADLLSEARSGLRPDTSPSLPTRIDDALTAVAEYESLPSHTDIDDLLSAIAAFHFRSARANYPTTESWLKGIREARTKLRTWLEARSFPIAFPPED